MSTQHAILGLLALGERHGYDMRRELEVLDAEWRLEFGQLYRLLRKLEDRGLIVSRSALGERGPQRKLYGLTVAGHRELEVWLGEPVAQVRERRDELPLKLKIGRALGVGRGLDSMIATRRADLEAQRVAAKAERVQAGLTGDPDRWLVKETRLRHVEGSIAALGAYQALLEPERTIRCAGSDDPVLEILGRFLSEGDEDIGLSSRPVGSLGGLLILREGGAHMAGTHLLDVETGEYNAPFIKRLLFEEPLVLVNVSHREQGLMVAHGNPHEIKSITDVAEKGIRLINRQRGAGTRLLLHAKLQQSGIEPEQVEGFDREASTHGAVAAAIADGDVDVGMGIRSVAQQWGLGFVPVGKERYDLAVPRAFFDSSRFRPVLEVLHDHDFRREVGARVGYDLSQTGEVVAEIR